MPNLTHIDLTNIKLIIFDLDNTLYNYDLCNDIALNTILNILCCDKEIFLIAKQNIKNIHKNTALEHDKLLQIKELFRLLNIKDTILLNNIIKLYYQTFLDNVKLYDGYIDFFKKCQNIKLVILTNNTLQIQLDIYNKLELYNYFNNIFTSYEIRFEKPNIKCYEYINNIYNFNKDEILMIGDSYESDGIGAINYGIKFYIIDSIYFSL